MNPLTRTGTVKTPKQVKGACLMEIVSNDEPANEPRYIRTPEHDAAKGPNSMGGNAWLEVSTGKTRLFRKGYDANKSWCGSDLARRKAIDGGKL